MVLFISWNTDCKNLMEAAVLRNVLGVKICSINSVIWSTERIPVLLSFWCLVRSALSSMTITKSLTTATYSGYPALPVPRFDALCKASLISLTSLPWASYLILESSSWRATHKSVLTSFFAISFSPFLSICKDILPNFWVSNWVSISSLYVFSKREYSLKCHH